MAVDFRLVETLVEQNAAQTRADVAREVQQAAEAARAAGQTAAEQARTEVERALRQAEQEIQRAQRDAQRAQRDADRAVRDAQRQVQRDGQVFVQPPWVQDFPGGPQIPDGAIVISIAFFVMCAVIAIGFPIARAFARRMDKRAIVPAADNDTQMRLERIEHAVDAIALEVERISEGQRFTSKVLADLRALPEPDPAEALAAPMSRSRERR